MEMLLQFKSKINFCRSWLSSKLVKNKQTFSFENEPSICLFYWYTKVVLKSLVSVWNVKRSDCLLYCMSARARFRFELNNPSRPVSSNKRLFQLAAAEEKELKREISGIGWTKCPTHCTVLATLLIIGQIF
jgi:hypothetical protein